MLPAIGRGAAWAGMIFRNCDVKYAFTFSGKREGVLHIAVPEDHSRPGSAASDGGKHSLGSGKRPVWVLEKTHGEKSEVGGSRYQVRGVRYLLPRP